MSTKHSERTREGFSLRLQRPEVAGKAGAGLGLEVKGGCLREASLSQSARCNGYLVSLQGPVVSHVLR